MHLIASPTTSIGAIWMELINRDKLARRMKAQGVSQRELARVAGWKSHAYLGRLLSGSASTLNTDPALRIAHYLHLDVDDIFVTRVATVAHRESTAENHNGAARGARRSPSPTRRSAA